MPANGRATVKPATIKGLSIGAIITTILLGLGWLLGAV